MKTIFEGKKLYAVMIVLLFIVTFFITFIILHSHYNFVCKDVIAENKLTANLLSTLIYEHQKATAIEILESYARQPLFIDAVMKKDFNRVIPHLKSLSVDHAEMDALFITDKHGTLWANYPVDSSGFGTNLAYRDWYKGVSKHWRPYISTLFRLIVLEKGLAVAVSVPVQDRNGKIIGILSAAQRIAFLGTLMKANILDPKKHVTLLDQEGNIIFSNVVPYQEKITKYPEPYILEKALAGTVIDMEIADTKGKGNTSFVSIAPVRGIGWSIIIEQDKNTILKSLYGYFIRSAATAFIIFLFLAAFVLYFRREYKFGKTRELLRAEKQYHTLFEAIADAVFMIDQETGNLLDVNPAATRMYGFNREEFLRMTTTDVSAEPEETSRAMKEPAPFIPLRYHRHKDGSVFPVELTASFFELQGRKTIIATARDITERKQVENTLKESEERYRVAIESSNDGVAIVQNDVHAYANPAFLAMFRYNALDEIIGQERYCIVHPDDYERVIGYAQARQRGEYVPTRYEFKGIRKDGVPIDVEVSVNTISYKGEKAILAYLRDNTDRKLAEDKIKSLLAEKELLLKEVHHRIKNHMNVIMSLLSLQSSTMKDNPSAVAALEDSRSRLQSMMVLYDKLYRSADFRAISTKEYLTSLFDEIISNFPKRQLITVEKQIDDFSLGAKILSPIGIILNELLTNTMKHAFVGRKEGLIVVSFSVKENHAILIISDNGIGFPESVDMTTSPGFGMQLVNILTEQLDGAIRFERKNGTMIILEFEV